MNYWKKEYTDGFFNVSRENGFLPIREPLQNLPHEYKELQDLINNLHVFQSENREEKGVLGIPNEIVEILRIPQMYSKDPKTNQLKFLNHWNSIDSKHSKDSIRKL